MRAILLLAAVAVAAGVTASAQAARPLETGVYDPYLTDASTASLAMSRIRDAGASFVRISVLWSAIAPAKPDAAFQPADPQSPEYAWESVDAEVDAAASAGLRPILDVASAPGWARVPTSGDSVSHPTASALAEFARALALRYRGGSTGLPRVRDYMLWNEPNLNTYITPQFTGTTPASPGIYRGMLNAFAGAVKSVSAADVVIAGGLAPYGIQRKGQPINKVLSVAPLTFMRDLLCVSGGAAPRRTCATKARFDVFSVHPYTWGGATHSAFSPDDVAIGDLPQVQQVLRSAYRLGMIQSAHLPQLWVTEFSWDTNPPDPKAIPIALQARWTSEALYHMWADGIGVVTWFLLRDEPLGSSPFQSGLYFAGATLAQDRPKPTLTAFRFPFVAYPGKTGTLVWGRTPDSASHSVVVERRAGSAWERVAHLQANRYGIFQTTIPFTSHTGYLRARVVGATDTSLPFGLKAVPDRRVSPFGS